MHCWTPKSNAAPRGRGIACDFQSCCSVLGYFGIVLCLLVTLSAHGAQFASDVAIGNGDGY